MIRATTGGVMRNYRKNLMSSFIASNKARDRVLTQRNFNSYAEAPADAAKAFRLRMSRLTVNSQYKICEDTYYKYQGAFSCLDTVDKLIDTENGGTQLQTLKSTTLKMLNDPTGDARTQLGKVLDEMSETIIQNMNQKYGDTFIFAGADGYNVPFEVTTREDGTKQLLYRGVPVDAAVPEVVMNVDGKTPMAIDPATGLVDPNGTTYVKTDTSSLIKREDFDNIVINDPTATQPQILKLNDGIGTPQRFNEKGEVDPNGDYYLNLEQAETMTKKDYDDACTDVEKLDYLVNKEKRFVDIGLGFQENEDGKLIESSGFNECLNGLTFLGYGLDEDGDPKNVYSIVQRLKEITESVPDGEDWSQATYDEFDALVGKLEKASSDFKTEYANMDAGTLKLKNNLDILEDNFYNLDIQTSNLEDADMVESITSFIWAEYAYNAALKVGNSILSQSLMDYMT